MSEEHPKGAPWRNFYGRTKGKTLKPNQRQALDVDLGPLTLQDVDWDSNPKRTPLDLNTIFAGKPVWLEIGFGGGEHMVHQAAQNPDVGIIGCEPYINGVAMLLRKIAMAGVENTRIHPGDVRDLFDESVVVVHANAYDREYLVPGGWFSTARCGAGRIPFSIPPTFQSLCRESATDVGLVSVHLGQGWEKGRL